MLIIFATINIILMVLMLYARSALRLFLAKHQAISSVEAMADFKQVARMNMYGALIYLVLGFVMLVMAVFITIKMGLLGLLIGLCFSIPSLLVSLKVKSLEDRSKNLPCDPTLKEEFEHVKEVWFKKALPDF